MLRVPKTLGNSFIYTLITVLQKGISFLLLPLYTLFLSPADYGILGVVGSVTSFMAMLVSLALEGAAQRFYYLHEEDKVYHKKLYGTIAVVILGNSITWGSIFIIGHKYLIDPFVGTIDFYPYVLLGLVTMIVTPIYTLFQRYLQAIQDGVKFGINSMLFFVINVALIILFLVHFKLGVIGVLWANLIVAVIFFIYVLIAFIPKLILRPDKDILKDSLKYSLPLLPHMLANWSNGTIDKLLVNGIRSQSDAGLYNLSQQYATVLNSIALGVNSAYLPWFFSVVKEGAVGYEKAKKFAEATVWGLATLGLIMAIFSREVLALMIKNPEFSEVWRIVPYVVFAYVFQGIYFFYVNVLFLKDTGVIFIITVATVVINVLLNLLLIPPFGFYGCAVACLITYFAKSIFALIISARRNKEIRFNTKSMYLGAFLAFVLSLLSLTLSDFSLGMNLLTKTLVCLLFVVFVYFRYKDTLLSFAPKLFSHGK